MHQAFTIPAIVAGGELNGLGIVRSLGAHGVPVTVMDPSTRVPAMRSRFAHAFPVESLEGQTFIDELRRFAASPAYPGQAVLFVTEERTVRTVSELRSHLPKGVHLCLPEHERLMALMHKKGFQDLAEQIGAAVPKTVRLQGLQDLAKAREMRFPCILKPSKKDYAYGARFKKAYKVNSVTEIESLYREIHPVLADMVVQEWIEGDDNEIYFCLQYLAADGQLVASFTGRKIRSWPLRVGGTASCTIAGPEADGLKVVTQEFFQQVGFVGMGSMEYKRDQRDGRFYMVEPTVARTDVQEEVATLNGVNLPLAAYCHELALPLPACPAPARPVIWFEPVSDRWAGEESGGQADARSQGFQRVDAYFRMNDPRPWVDLTMERIGQRLRHVLRR